MEIQQLIEKWTNEIAKIKSHIKKHEDTFGYPAVASRERLEAISEILADIKHIVQHEIILNEKPSPKCPCNE